MGRIEGFLLLYSFSPIPLCFQQMEEALCDSIIITVTTPAHAGFQIVIGQEHAPLMVGKL